MPCHARMKKLLFTTNLIGKYMIDYVKGNFEPPAPNFGADTNHYLTQMREAEKKIYRRVVLYIGVPLIMALGLGAILYHPSILMFGIMILVMLFLYSIFTLINVENKTGMAYKKEFQTKFSEWASNTLIPYLYDEHGIIPLGDDYLALIRESGDGLKVKTKDGEILRIKMDGIEFEWNKFLRVTTFDKDGLGIVITQKSLAL